MQTGEILTSAVDALQASDTVLTPHEGRAARMERAEHGLTAQWTDFRANPPKGGDAKLEGLDLGIRPPMGRIVRTSEW